MAGRHAVGPSLFLAAALVGAAAGSWRWWQGGAARAPQATAPTNSSEDIQQRYPMPEELPELKSLSRELVETVIQANPFSSKRRTAPPPSEEVLAATQVRKEPPRPQFVYKGRVQLGERERAILEDTTTSKTHFLEVGQEVAGFKVLDIAENRVVLSDPASQEDLVLSIASGRGL